MEKSVFHRPRRLSIYMEESESVKDLNTALTKAMMEFTPILRDTTCEKMVQGRRVRYRVASLHALRQATMPALLKHGVLPHQDYCISDEGVTLVTTLSYGDQYRRSTLPIRQFEDDDRQKAHMTKMRKAGYEAALCLSCEEDDAAPEEEAPQEYPSTLPQPSTNGKVHPASMWKQQEHLATKALNLDCQTVAQVEDTLSKIKAKIDVGDMDPHCLGKLETLALQRIKELSAAKASKAQKPQLQAGAAK